MTLKTALKMNNKDKSINNTEKVLSDFRKIPEFVEMESFITTVNKTSGEDKNVLIDNFLESGIYSKLSLNSNLKKLNISDTGLFPIDITPGEETSGCFSLFVYNTKIDGNNTKIEIIEEKGKKYLFIQGVPLNHELTAINKTDIKIAIHDNIENLINTTIQSDDFFKDNEIELKNLIQMEYIQMMSGTCKIESLGKDKNGKPVVLNADNFNNFFSIEKRVNNEEDVASNILPFSYDENSKLNIFNNNYSVYDIDKVYNEKLNNLINPLSSDLIDIKIQINELILSRDTGTLRIEEIKDPSMEIIKAYKAIYNKYNKDVFLDNTALTEVEKAFNEFSILLKTYNEKKDSLSDDDGKKLNKLEEFMNNKVNILMDKITAIDSYLQETSDEEKTNLENSVGLNGELRQKISSSPQSYLRTDLFENLLKFILDCDKYKDTPILIGHAGIGKTFSSKVAASLLKKPLFQLTGHYDFSLSDLVGTIKQNKKGYFVLSKGPLVRLAENGGMLILDEFNALPQEVMKALNGLLDEIKSGGNGIWNVQIQGQNLAIKVSPDLRIVLTGNPSGYSAEYGNLAGVTTDLSRRTVVRELPPIEIEIKNINKKDIVKFPMIEAYFNNLDISNNDYFKGRSKEEQKIYKLSLKNKTTKFLTELLVLLGKGFIDKSNQVGLDAKNFYVVVADTSPDMDTEQALRNVALSIPSIVINRLNEIIKYTDGNANSDMMKYLENYIFEALRSDIKGKVIIEKLTSSINS